MVDQKKKTWTRRKTLLAHIIADLFLIIISLMLAYFLRLGIDFTPRYIDFLLIFTLPIVLLKIIVLYLFGLYNRVRRYASMATLHRLIQAITVSSISVVLILYFIQAIPLPRSVFIIDWLLNIIFLGGTRFFNRSLQEIRLYATMPGTAKQVLIIGADDEGELLIREMLRNKSIGRVPVGIIDNDPNKQGMRIHGIRVLGTTKDLQRILNREKVDEVVIAMPSASREVKRQIVSECEDASVKCRTIPGIYEILDGHVAITQIRDVDVEDVLGRDPVQMKLEEISEYLSGKCVLVTGAGGSIGSELCRQIAMVEPSFLILLDQSENDLFNIDRKLRSTHKSINIVPIVQDIVNGNEINRILERYRPAAIFHAAAYKHVPLLQSNPEVALLNNFIGTKTIAKAAIKNEVGKLILISTDKAVEPKNFMGISKALAELSMQSLADGSSTDLVIVRFGNVLGSSGSVVPIFKEQISKGGPVTVTHPDMRRYFMTIPEAVQLVIQAGAMGKGREIFVLDMGEQVRIKDLAENMIRLSGFEPEKDIAIEYIGTRPGEKLEEKLFGASEKKIATTHENIFIAQTNAMEKSMLKKKLLGIEKLIEKGNAKEAMELAKELITGYENIRKSM